MLISVETLEPITHIPNEREYRYWRKRLTDEQYSAIESEIERRMGAGEVQTAGWIPGDDWSNTPFEPIYSDACVYDAVASWLCFGLCLLCSYRSIRMCG